jgi:hypothetical protein
MAQQVWFMILNLLDDSCAMAGMENEQATPVPAMTESVEV